MKNNVSQLIVSKALTILILLPFALQKTTFVVVQDRISFMSVEISINLLDGYFSASLIALVAWVLFFFLLFLCTLFA